MKLRIKFNHWLPRLLGDGAITLYPFILVVCSKELALQDDILSHEMVHIEQVRTLGWLNFYSHYLWYFFKSYVKTWSFYTAYMAIPFEIEAYAHEHDQKYKDAAQVAAQSA